MVDKDAPQGPTATPLVEKVVIEKSEPEAPAASENTNFDPAIFDYLMEHPNLVERLKQEIIGPNLSESEKIYALRQLMILNNMKEKAKQQAAQHAAAGKVAQSEVGAEKGE